MFDDLLNSFVKWDQNLWYRINVLWQYDVLDQIAPLLRNPKSWIPLYLFLLIFLPCKFGKKGIYWCLAFLITFAISDYTSASIIKPIVQRIRPCNDLILQKVVHLLVDCGSGYSFPSSHATNHFALAFFMIISLRNYYSWIQLPVFLWAISISYAQIYVGVHYPLDVLGGAFLGILIGLSTGLIFNRRIGLID